MNKLKESKLRLGGVKYWAQWFPMGRKPAYEVFVYAGSDHDQGQHYFVHFKDPRIMICKSIYQLTRDLSFRPFVYESIELDRFAKDSGLI